MKYEKAASFMAKAASFLVRKVTRPQSIILCGKKLSIDYAHWSPQMIRILFLGDYELEERTLVPSVVEPDDRVLEIGSAVGFIGMLTADVVGEKNVVLVEANPQLVDTAKKNFALNGLDITVLHGAAVANGNIATVQFHIHDNFWSSSLSSKPGTAEIVDVPALSLQALLVRFRPNVLIMDIEGGEYDLLMNTDLSCLEKICVEVHARYIGDDKVSALIRHLIFEGFDLRVMKNSGDNLLFLKESTPGTVASLAS